MVRVAPPVSPLEGVGGGHVDVLEVVVPGVGAVRPGLGEGDATRSSGSRGLSRGEARDQTQAKHLVLEIERRKKYEEATHSFSDHGLSCPPTAF